MNFKKRKIPYDLLEMTTSNVYVRPITYRLILTNKEMIGMRPYFKIKSEKDVAITKSIKHPRTGEPIFEDELKIKGEERGTIELELRDRSRYPGSDLLGTAKLKYSTLAPKGYRAKKWIPLLGLGSVRVGEIQVAITVPPKIDKSKTSEKEEKFLTNMKVVEIEREFEEANPQEKENIEVVEENIEDVQEAGFGGIGNFFNSILSNINANLKSVFNSSSPEITETPGSSKKANQESLADNHESKITNVRKESVKDEKSRQKIVVEKKSKPNDSNKELKINESDIQEYEDYVVIN